MTDQKLREALQKANKALVAAYEHGVCVKARYTTRGDKWRLLHKEAIDRALSEVANRRYAPLPPQAGSQKHHVTDACGFDRNASHAEDTYVCTCGYRSGGKDVIKEAIETEANQLESE